MSCYTAADIEENITKKEEQEEGVEEILVCAKPMGAVQQFVRIINFHVFTQVYSNCSGTGIVEQFECSPPASEVKIILKCLNTLLLTLFSYQTRT